MNKPIEILGSAQAFGFGGITELLALESSLRLDPRGKDVIINLVRNPQFDSVINDIRHRFNILTEKNNTDSYVRSLFNRPALERIDMVLSSYDTAGVFYGWFKNIPVFFYDGMMWFWNLDLYEKKIQYFLDHLRSIKQKNDEFAFINTYEEMAANDYHLTVLLAYYLSNRVYVRDGQNVVQRISRLPNILNKTKIIGAMVDPTYAIYNNLPKEHILVSLSGSLAPTLSYEDNLFFSRGALAFSKEAYDEMSINLPWIFCCHPQLFQSLREEGLFNDLPKNFLVKPSMPYAENLKAISQAYALFISPGFSSVQEAALFGTPVFFLPEQNGGQPTGFSTLTNIQYPTEHNLTVTQHINNGAIQIGEYDVKELYEGISKIWSSEMRSVRQSVIRQFFEVLLNPDSREHLIINQHDAVERLMGGFDGAISTAIDILNYVIGSNE